MVRNHGKLHSMTEIQVSKFKATCLAVLARVGQTREPILVTRRGKPIARILPPAANPAGNWLGSMRGSVEVHGDIVAPACEESDWEALR